MESLGRNYSAPKPVREQFLSLRPKSLPGERLFGPQASSRIAPVKRDSNPRPSDDFVVFAARSDTTRPPLKSLGIISIKTRCVKFFSIWCSGLRLGTLLYSLKWTKTRKLRVK